MKKILGLLFGLSLLLFSLNTYADTSSIEYNGRIDFSNTRAPKLIWQGTVIKADFFGPTLVIGFDALQGTVYFNLNLDGKTSILKAENGWLTIPVENAGQHKVTLFKRTEASVGHVGFLGFSVKNKVIKLVQAPSHASNINKPLRLLFYGDSITAGACNEDGAEDQWVNFKTHNSAKSYAAFTAKGLNADYRNISISGMGISVGYQPYIAEQVWNRLYPNPQAPLADLNLWQPNIVFLNFGENDDSFSHNQQNSFPKNYAAKYIQLVRNMRKAYPKSHIVILRGGMYGGAKSARLREPWEQVVKTLELSDSNIRHYVFKHWSSLHPRVADHKKMALELVAWVKSNPFLKS